MPIVNIGESKQLEFGHGDIVVSPGLLKTDDVIGAVCFVNHEPREIGFHEDHYPNEVKTIDETPVRMIFEKIESIDVVIWALEEVKRMMTEAQTERKTLNY